MVFYSCLLTVRTCLQGCTSHPIQFIFDLAALAFLIQRLRPLISYILLLKYLFLLYYMPGRKKKGQNLVIWKVSACKILLLGRWKKKVKCWEEDMRKPTQSKRWLLNFTLHICRFSKTFWRRVRDAFHSILVALHIREYRLYHFPI